MHIKKIVVDGVEYLPPIAETKLFEPWEQNKSKQAVNKALLYNAVADRENYFQDHSVTAFGNAEYERAVGVVQGICLILGLEETIVGRKIVFKKGERTYLSVAQVKKTKAYKREKKELDELMNAL